MLFFRMTTLSCFILTLCISITSSSEHENNTISLFNGNDLSGWEGEMQYWSVEDGAITGRTMEENPGTHNTFLIWQGGEVKDFELTLKFKVIDGNSGVQFRSRRLEGWDVAGYQADLEDGPRYTGGLYDEHGRGQLALRGQKTVIDEDGTMNKEWFADANELYEHVNKQDWNTYTIWAKGNHIKLSINGHLMSEVIDNHKEGRHEKGIIALQIHSGPPMTVQFKDIVLKKLD